MELQLLCVTDAIKNSFIRMNRLPKKITPMIARKEIEVARVIGEVAGVERILNYIVTSKKQGTFNLEDLEAELHTFIQTGLSYGSKNYIGYEMFSLEGVLRQYNYLPKEEVNVSSESN